MAVKKVNVNGTTYDIDDAEKVVQMSKTDGKLYAYVHVGTSTEQADGARLISWYV